MTNNVNSESDFCLSMKHFALILPLRLTGHSMSDSISYQFMINNHHHSYCYISVANDGGVGEGRGGGEGGEGGGYVHPHADFDPFSVSFRDYSAWTL